jgi:electron transfer flavoprotein alpha/beta subunit
MGARYKDYDVSVEQTIVVRRTFRVERSLDQAAAIEQARRIARDYALTTVNACRTGETVNIISVGDTRDTAARARAVN